MAFGMSIKLNNLKDMQWPANISSMPRTARLDAPGVLHHNMIRGIARQRIFRNIQDRDDLLERISVILPETHTSCYAWPVFLRAASLSWSVAV